MTPNLETLEQASPEIASIRIPPVAVATVLGLASYGTYDLSAKAARKVIQIRANRKARKENEKKDNTPES